MHNPLLILPLMLRAKRPSRVDDMPAVAMPFWIGRGYEGMTFFGHIITHSHEAAADFNARYDALKNHEMIHLYQARSTHDSWLLYYARYLYYWLQGLRLGRRMPHAGYLLNPFELEAYAHMHDLHYLSDKEKGTDGWRRYALMSSEERLAAYRLIFRKP